MRRSGCFSSWAYVMKRSLVAALVVATAVMIPSGMPKCAEAQTEGFVEGAV